MNDDIILKVAKFIFVLDYVHTDTHQTGDLFDDITHSISSGEKFWDRILNEFTDPTSNWYNKKHVGDCVKLPMTCSTCVYDEYIDKAKKYLTTGKIDI